MEKENEAIQKQLDCLKQAMDEEDEEVSLEHTDYGHTKSKSLILCSPNSKWVLIVWPKIPLMP